MARADPRGEVSSPLLTNVLLDLLDKELENRSLKFVRYADDFAILVKSKRAGDRILTSITRFVERKLKLKVNNQKSQVIKVSHCKFLGFTCYGKYLRMPTSLPAVRRLFQHEKRCVLIPKFGLFTPMKYLHPIHVAVPAIAVGLSGSEIVDFIL